MSKIVLILLSIFFSTTVMSQSLFAPTGVMVPGGFYGSSAVHCYDGSGLSGTPTNVTNVQGITHDANVQQNDAAYTSSGTIAPSWTFNFPIDNVKGIALWIPCAQHPHGDAPFKKISVYNGTTTEIFDLGPPTTTVQIINFSSTFMNTTSIEIKVLETWYDLTMTSGNCGSQGWGVYKVPSSHTSYNVVLGEIRFIRDDQDPCNTSIDIDNKIDRCGLSLNASISNIPPGYNVVSTTWTFGDGYSSNLLNPTHYYANTGAYNVCLEVVVFNGEKCCTIKKCIEVEIEKACADGCNIKADINVNKLENCEFKFFGNIAYTGTPISNWVWDFGDGTTGIGSNVSHIYSNPGSYVVSLIVFGSSSEGKECCFVTIKKEINVKCEPKSKEKVMDGQSNISDEKSSDFTIYPNPTNDMFNVEIENIENSVIEVVNSIGKTILIQNVNANVTNIDLSNQSNGVYFVKVLIGNVMEVKRVIKN